ncbi:MAG: ribosome maturation factor RimM [Hyphomicrobiales bacterium]
MRRDLVLIGRVTGAHGIRGEVKLQSFTAEPQAIARYGPLRTDNGTTIEIERLRPQKQGFIATLKGVGDRNRAEALAGTGLFVDRASLPAPGVDESYIHDLVGLTVVTRDGTGFGKVVDVVNYGAGDLLDIARAGEANILIPFSDAFVPEVDVAEGRLAIDLPDGYLEET